MLIASSLKFSALGYLRAKAGRVAVVAGGTFGVGSGIASVLAQYGARVFVTGRSAHDGLANEAQIAGIRCDHRVDADADEPSHSDSWRTCAARDTACITYSTWPSHALQKLLILTPDDWWRE